MIRLTQQQYLDLLAKQKDPAKRALMKRWAYSAMYGANHDMPVFLPEESIDNLEP